MKLDVKDRKLLYWLDQNSRATNKELAKKIGLSEQAIGYKLKRLEENSVIRNYVTFVNTLALGYSHYKVLLRLQNTKTDIEERLLGLLVGHSHIRWVAPCSGRWDVNFSVMVKSDQEFIDIYRGIEGEFGDYIAEKNVSILVKAPGFTKGHLIGQKSLVVLEYETRDVELDQVDLRILKSISQAARKNVVEIARELKTTVDVVRYRLRKLEERNVIAGYTMQLGLDKMGLLRYSVYFVLHKMPAAIEKRMVSFAQAHNNIIFFVSLVGSFDATIELEVDSYYVLEKTLKKFRELFAENIKNFEIVFYTDELKYDFYPFPL